MNSDPNQMKTQKKKKLLSLILSENIECLAIAIAMALMLKFFIIEAYKIPSGSMQPTIFGNPETRLFDRVLVNKFIYLIDEPRRWDVIVFKFPLIQTQNYIKRLIGLPGEKITIKNGDIYVNDEIARKPRDVNNSVLKKVYPSGRNGERFEQNFTVTGEGRITAKNRIELAPAGRATMRKIRTKYLHGYDADYGIPFPAAIRPDEHHFTGDLQLAFSVELDSDSGGIEGCIEENGRRHVFFLKGRAHGSPSFIRNEPLTRGHGEVSMVWSSQEVALESGRSYDIVLANIDDRLAIEIDGDEVAAYEYTTDALETGDDPNAVSFGPVEANAVFDDVTLSRDIYYLHDSPRGYADYHVPQKHYFAMGDNTQNSSDGRRWRSATLTMKDGRIVEGEYLKGAFPIALNSLQSSRHYPFQDIYGDIHNVCGKNLAKRVEIDAESFVHEKFLLGKALAVFWPIYPHFRWKLIR